ncbi:hypothetical protein [uncultured Sphaerochaeta sp.]|uniref:hypothetical protein n=1 Tax=uncultured Sphaerochaeta sp. TaxID=886478 RepID=UPI002A0A5A5F|nr:hypothetical protein [uncultured Sphaerochaeta sp.]
MAYVLYDRPSTDKATFLFDSRLDNLQIAQFKHVLDTYAPFLNPYYSEKSLLTGNLSFQPDTTGEEKIFGFKGIVSADLAFTDLSIGNRTPQCRINLASPYTKRFHHH